VDFSSLLGLISVSFFWVLGIYFFFAGRLSHFYMGSFLLIQGLANAILWFNYTPVVKYFPFFIFAAVPLRFLWGPFLYFFIKAFLEDKVKKDLSYFLHFVPAIVICIYLCNLYKNIPEEDLIQNILNKEWLFKINRIPNILIFLQNISYIIFLLIHVFRLQIRLSRQYSKTDIIKLNWVVNILVILAAVHFLIPIIINQIGTAYFRYLFVVHIPLLTYVSWHLVKTPALFNDLPQEEEKKQADNIIDEEASKKIVHIMDTDKPFLDTEFSVKKLAELVHIPAYQLSEILNKQFCKNFSEFTNEYRIQEAKKQLLAPENQHLTLEGIGQNCGFKSKSTFFSEFKKRCGKTPLEFRKSQKTEN